MDIVASDFDHTLFIRNIGLIGATVKYLEEKGYPVYIVTYRAPDQQNFILETLSQTNLNIIGIGFAESRKKEPHTKLAIYQQLMKKYNIIEVLDDDDRVVVGLRKQGIKAGKF